MRKLIYWMTVSLDGFIAGPGGEIDWSAPDEELHRFHNQRVGVERRAVKQCRRART
jgi:dihydrofolate reductase